MLTVCIPTVNNDTDFAVLYQQLQGQKNIPFDTTIYVCDNSKTGYAQRIVERYQWRLETIIDRTAGNIMSSWNHAINMDRGNVIFLNDDLLIPQDFLSRMNKAFEDGHVCVNPDAPGFPPKKRVRPEYKWESESRIQSYYFLREPMDPLLPVLKGWCFGMSRDLINQVGLFDEQFLLWYGDTDMDRRIAKNHHFTFITELFVHHWGSTSSFKIEREEFSKLNLENQLAFEKKYNLAHEDRGLDKYLDHNKV